MKAQSTQNRMISLDFLRGLTIAFMILVNNPGSEEQKFYLLGHAPWHGITIADFVFPFFVFIMGISITLSLSKLKNNKPAQALYFRIAKRTFLLFGIGILLNLLMISYLGGLRIAGVLQRIAIVYLVCSILYMKTNWKAQTAIATVILLGYWLMMTLVHVPETGKPSLEPVNNLASWFDRKYLPGVLWDKVHDPEGILSTFPAIVTGMLGMLTGTFMRKFEKLSDTVRKLPVLGISLLLTGIAWSFVFPLNKNLWTSSFVLVTAGSALLVFTLCIWVIDIRKRDRLVFPFIVFGSNAITAYIISFLFLGLVTPAFFAGKGLVQVCWNAMVSAGISPEFSSLIWALMYVALCYIPVYVLYRKKIFVKL
jgi:predicted acyltransferase